MVTNYAYNYATINPATKMCMHVQTTTQEIVGEENIIEIPVYDGNYLFKYYIDVNLYEDAVGTIPWTSSLL